jgi:hypothetical protein
MADRKTNYPDSDESARKSQSEDLAMKSGGTTETALEGQTSTKTGKHSSVEKLAASRPEMGQGRGAVPVDGAFGKDEGSHPVTGRLAGPDTNQFRCETCGRWFNRQTELDAHQPECALAKAAAGGHH